MRRLRSSCSLGDVRRVTGPLDDVVLGHQQPDAGTQHDEVGLGQHPRHLEPELVGVPEVVVVAGRDEGRFGVVEPGVARTGEALRVGVVEQRDRTARSLQGLQLVLRLLLVMHDDEVDVTFVVLLDD